MSAQKTAGKPVVAELGRPETAQETAARKAESSRNHRQRQTVNNLVYSLLACLAIVAVVVLMVPRNAPTIQKNVNYVEVAKQGQGTEPDALATPELPLRSAPAPSLRGRPRRRTARGGQDDAVADRMRRASGHR